MSVFDEIMTQVENAINAWDFSAAFPNGWPATSRGVTILQRNPFDLIENILKESASGATMPMPIISLAPGQSDAVFTGFGGLVPQLSTITGTHLKGMRIATRIIVSAWADQALGGEETVTKLGGELYQCFIYNQNRLPSFRRLRPATADTAYEDQPELWVFDTHVEGSAVMNYEPNL